MSLIQISNLNTASTESFLTELQSTDTHQIIGGTGRVVRRFGGNGGNGNDGNNDGNGNGNVTVNGGPGDDTINISGNGNNNGNGNGNSGSFNGNFARRKSCH
ncbi:MAG: hypothetical protein RLZZ135_2080 [Cyanobacteriota bacterium]|jgi:hypothetical protein